MRNKEETRTEETKLSGTSTFILNDVVSLDWRSEVMNVEGKKLEEWHNKSEIGFK